MIPLPATSLEPVPAMDTSYLTTQVSTIIGQLHGLFDEIGVPSHERESRESEVFGIFDGIDEAANTILAVYGSIRNTT